MIKLEENRKNRKEKMVINEKDKREKWKDQGSNKLKLELQ